MLIRPLSSEQDRENLALDFIFLLNGCSTKQLDEIFENIERQSTLFSLGYLLDIYRAEQSTHSLYYTTINVINFIKQCHHEKISITPEQLTLFNKITIRDLSKSDQVFKNNLKTKKIIDNTLNKYKECQIYFLTFLEKIVDGNYLQSTKELLDLTGQIQRLFHKNDIDHDIFHAFSFMPQNPTTFLPTLLKEFARTYVLISSIKNR